MNKDEQRLDYAWKWFNFHADQRTKMFNFMLLGLGLFASALVTALDKQFYTLAQALGVAGFVLALAFWRIDRRNKQLYEAALDVLFSLEQDHLFSRRDKFSPKLDGKEVPYAIGWRIHQDDRPDGKTPTLLQQFAQGRHRVLMPAIILGLGAMFLVVGLDIFELSKRADAVQRVELVIPPAVTAGASAVASSAASSAAADPAASGPEASTPLLPSSLPVTVAPQARSWGWLALLPGLALFAWGVVSAIAGRRAQGVAQLLAGAVLSATGLVGINFKGEVKLDPKLELHLLDKLDARIRVQLGSPGVPAQLVDSHRFGGFAPGKADRDCTADSAALEALRKKITAARDKHDIVVLAVGGTDRMPLNAELRRQRESNAGLARARIEQAWSCLALAPGTDLRFVPLVTGPAYTPERDTSSQAAASAMQADRAVDLHVLAVPRATAKK